MRDLTIEEVDAVGGGDGVGNAILFGVAVAGAIVGGPIGVGVAVGALLLISTDASGA